MVVNRTPKSLGGTGCTAVNQAFRAVESSIGPDVKTCSPDTDGARSSPPNSSWTVKFGGNTTATELPGAPGLPKADTGKDIRLWPNRRSRSVEPPGSKTSKARSNEPLSPEYRRCPNGTETTTPEGAVDRTARASGSPTDVGPPAAVATTLVDPAGSVSCSRS